VLNVSGNGMLVVIPIDREVGATLQVKVSLCTLVEYLFTCQVVRRFAQDEMFILGLHYSCVPLQIRRIARFPSVQEKEQEK
jgi:hypothetical protein